MAVVNFAEAARLVGVARSTIFRQVKRGELSATRLPEGARGIDTSELERVYGRLAPSPSRETNVPATSPETELLRDQVQSLKAQLEATQEEKRRLWNLWEQAERERRALEQRLLSAPVKRGWWRRLFWR